MSVMLVFIAIIISFTIPTITRLVFPHKVTYKELVLSIFISVVCSLAMLYFIKMFSISDVEIWNGQVTEKFNEHVSCNHSYPCNPRTVCTGSGAEAVCTIEYDTCYEHSYDVDWIVKSNVGSSEINRVDRQGLDEPPRWTKSIIGEPYAESYSFTNYIKASPDSLFAGSEELIKQYANDLPQYPEINDYYKINRVISKGVSIDKDLNSKLNEIQKKWGPQKQLNLIPIFLSEAYSQDFFKAIEANWLGGKKNDVIIVTQLSNSGNVNWTRIISRSENKSFDKSIEFDMNQMKEFKTDDFIAILDKNIMEKFNREDFHKYEYLLNEFTPSTLAISIGILLSFLINLVMSYYSVREDIFGDETFRRFK